MPLFKKHRKPKPAPRYRVQNAAIPVQEPPRPFQSTVSLPSAAGVGAQPQSQPQQEEQQQKWTQPRRQPGASQSQPHLPLTATQQHVGGGRLNQGAALVDRIHDQISAVISAMDGKEEDDEAGVMEGVLEMEDDIEQQHSTSRRGPGQTVPAPRHAPRKALAKTSLGSAYFSKVWLYANSRLPPYLPPLRVYISTYPLLCLAARYSLSSYSSNHSPAGDPTPASSSDVTPIHIPSSLRLGTKAMLMALHTLDTSNTLVLAIRGSATFADWAVNFRRAPDAPDGFLDDPGNFVHSGFLAVARAMAGPVAERIAAAVQANADRWGGDGGGGASLLLTGHSAGGAVASLLFAHMLSQAASVASPLKSIASVFHRVHCVTFGAPPVSLLPLHKPTDAGAPASGGRRGAQQPRTAAQKRWRKSMFFAFVNEGDPVVRADPAFVRSLVELYRAPAPVLDGPVQVQRPLWPVPSNSLSNGGRLVALRAKAKHKPKKRTRFLGFGAASASATGAGDEIIEAVLTSDEQLREVVFGDPAAHSMRLYAERVETLAKNAAIGR